MSKAKVLIVEDEGVLALDIERSLRSFGIDVVGVSADAEQALVLARDHRPDLALVDIRIQGAKDGIETAISLKAELDVPVVYLTAHGDPKTIERAHATQPLGYLLKPFKKPDLQNTVSIAIARSAYERELRLRERLVSTTLGSVGEAIIATDADARISYLNGAAETLLATDARTAHARLISDVVRLLDERNGELLNPALRALTSQARVDVPTATLAVGENTTRLVVATASPVTESGVCRGSVVVLRDLTELLTMRRQLEFADRLLALGTMAAGVAHEINNPLSFISSNIEFALRHVHAAGPLGDWPDVANALEEAIEGARRVTQIVADLRALGRPHLEGVQPIDVHRAIKFALAVTSAEWKPYCSLSLDLCEVPMVMADETRLGQVLVNLIVNAAHAMRSTDAATNQLTLRTRTNANHEVTIAVCDTGSGIDSRVRARIFDPFFTTKGPSLGSGLGLPIARSIVDSLGGHIDVESTEGRGTTFTITLPPTRGRA